MTGPTRAWAAQTFVWVIRCGILTVFVEGVRRRDPGAIVNAVLTFAVTHIPDAIEEIYGFEFRPWQRVYAASAMLAHAFGMLGPYDDVWWWDHVTHTLSATLLGGIVHVTARRRSRDPLPRILAATAGLGILWEFLEYVIHTISRRLGIEPVLVHYNKRETVLDLLFNILGALLAYAFGDRLLRNFIQRTE